MGRTHFQLCTAQLCIKEVIKEQLPARYLSAMVRRVLHGRSHGKKGSAEATVMVWSKIILPSYFMAIKDCLLLVQSTQLVGNASTVCT